MLEQLFTSKKFIAMIGGILLALVNWGSKRLGIPLSLDPETLNWALTLVAAYIVGQGVADVGKEKAKILAAKSIGGTP